jgi:phage head maturation protease
MKFLTAQFKGRDEEKREITALASTPSLDRDKEIIRSDAWDLTSFKKHPVLVLVHDWAKLWLGKITEITPTSDGLFFRAVFAKTAAAEEAWALIRDTGIAAFSVSFLPIESDNVLVRNLTLTERKQAIAAGMTLDNSVRVYTRAELMEISLCSLPSNRESLLLSWKALAKSVELRAALDEITIEGPPPPSREALAAEVRELRAKMNEIVLAYLKPSEIRNLPPAFRERLKSYRGADIIIEGRPEKPAEEIDVTPEELNRLVEKALKDQIEVAIAKIRGRVI